MGKEAFPVKGKAKSKWLAYNMAMRARVFDDWTDAMLKKNPDALVLHIGCGLDSRCLRVKEPYTTWIDLDFPDVIAQRRAHFAETPNYQMVSADASNPDEIATLPAAETAIIILEGLSMYLTNEQLRDLFQVFDRKYPTIHLLIDVYTEFAAKASKYKNPVNEVGVTKLYGVDHADQILAGTKLKLKAGHSLTPDELVHELTGFDRWFFQAMFGEKIYRKIYRLYEFETAAPV